MPEGDTVWRTAKHLDQALSGSRLVETDFRVPALATVDLAGEPVVATLARGKHLLTRIGETHTLHTHLKMEGAWHLYRQGTSWRRPVHEARVVLRTDRWTAVGFALGIIELVARDQEDAVVGHLGPDLLGPDWDEAEALRRLRSVPARPVGGTVIDERTLAGTDPPLSPGHRCRPAPPSDGSQREIGEALLDQRCLAGIGTVYRSETLFLAGVSPFLAVWEVSDLSRVVELARRLLMANRERARQVTTGNTRRGEEHWVYGRTGRPCRRCGRRIERAMQGRPPHDRVIYWCPRCQSAPPGSSRRTTGS